MNENICKRLKPVFPDAPKSDPLARLAVFECEKPKNPDFLYCEDCMKEIWNAPPRYQCFVEGCPANHPSKYEVCHADTLPK